MPAMPHMPSEGPLDASDRPARRTRQQSPRGLYQDAEVEAERAVGDPLEVVRELLGPAHLARKAQLREPRNAGPDHEPLPVGRDLAAQLLEERRADRPRTDEAHVADEEVPQLRQLVELRPPQDDPDARQLGLRQPRQLL